MKKVNSIILALVMLVSVSACGKKDVKKTDPNVGVEDAGYYVIEKAIENGETVTAEEFAETDHEEEEGELPFTVATDKPASPASGGDSVGDVSGERINTGIIGALCPEGWKSYDVADYLSDDDQAMDLTRLVFNKGAQTEEDQYSTPAIEISYHDKDSYFTPPQPEEYFVDSPMEWGPVELSGRSWEGFVDLVRGDSYIWAKEGDYHLLVILWQESQENPVFLEDADVEAIISSIGIE